MLCPKGYDIILKDRAASNGVEVDLGCGGKNVDIIIIIIIIIIRNLYSAIMPLGGYRGAGGTGR